MTGSMGSGVYTLTGWNASSRAIAEALNQLPSSPQTVWETWKMGTSTPPSGAETFAFSGETITNIYLAGSWSRKDELKDYRAVLDALGFTVVSRWLDEADGPHSVYTPNLPHQDSAIRDLEDIDRCDLVVCFTNDPLRPTVGGGRHFETGYAYGLEKELVYIGEREHVFHYLPDATVLSNVNDLYLWLLLYPNTLEFEERIAARGVWA